MSTSTVLRRALRPAAAGLAASALILSAANANAVILAPTPTANTWGTNGRVTEILPVGGGQMVIAGAFTAVTDSAGGSHPAANLALLDATGAAVSSWTAGADNEVDALALVGGRLYLGGKFDQVDGKPHRRLAAVDLGTGALIDAFTATANGQVFSLAGSPSSVFVSGSFTSVKSAASGTVARAYVAKLDAVTGGVDPGWVADTNAKVRSVIVSPDNAAVYLGGDFTSVGSTYARYGAALTTSDPAELLPYRSAVPAPILKQAYYNGDVLLAIGGYGGACASVSATTGAPQWIAWTDGNVQAVTAYDGVAYCGGHFSLFGGAARQHIAAVELAGPSISSWNPGTNSALGVYALANDGAALFAGGDFTKAGSRPRAHLAEFSPVP
ncbi:MAG: hypothetical protein M3P23_17005 [Actinomycetota bacterium]|nr:hypothetical protein [Actinomycetota bacterium]